MIGRDGITRSLSVRKEDAPALPHPLVRLLSVDLGNVAVAVLSRDVVAVLMNEPHERRRSKPLAIKTSAELRIVFEIVDAGRESIAHRRVSNLGKRRIKTRLFA
jgi:hypothetical protein